ncbi:MAG: hypothetical protein JW838_06905 [Spirochaetes bacterium]|nr:hypothetical protein [Spirochaetota bacterium]
MAVQRIPIRDIDRDDEYFKISRNRIADDLRSSIREFGVLDAPVLLDEGGRLRTVFGLNRLEVLAEMGAGYADAAVLHSLEEGWYVSRLLLRSHRNEIGPVGKIRALAILDEYFGMEPDRRRGIASRGLGVPGDFATDRSLNRSVHELPRSLGDYLDCRGVPFRVIRDLLGLPAGAVEALSSWVDGFPLKVNVFRSLVDMIADITDRDGWPGPLGAMLPGGPGGGVHNEEELRAAMHGARYPEYEAHRRRADDAADYFRSRGIRVAFPPFFEGDAVELTVRVARGDDPVETVKSLGALDPDRLGKLRDSI